MSKSLPQWWSTPPAIVGHGVAALSVLAALVAGLSIDNFMETAPFVSLFICAIMFAAWFGGLGPGLLATALSILAFVYYFVPPGHSFTLVSEQIPRVVLFAVAALFVALLTGAQRHSAESLRRAHDDLEDAVEKLESLNRALRVESAERKRSETYLAEAQLLTRTGSFAWTMSSGNLVWSEETYRILGVDRSIEPTIDVVLKSIHPDDRELVRHQIARALKGGQAYEHEHRLLMPDGSVKRLHVRAHRVKHQSGEEEIVGALTDVTEIRNAQEALHSARTELAHATRVTTLGEFTTSIAHEVNQPLAAIVTNGEVCLRLLDRDMPDLAELREGIDAMIGNARRASGIIRRIRAFSKKAEPEMSTLDIGEVIDEAIALVHHEALDQRVAMRLETASGLATVRGDRIQLQQVIINLMMNGIQAMARVTDHTRVLFIRARPHESDHVLVAVEDVGVGIEPEDLTRLFNPFYTTKPEGLGMGLSICRSIIEAHGGEVWASRNSGPGMTFQFTVPAYRGG